MRRRVPRDTEALGGMGSVNTSVENASLGEEYAASEVDTLLSPNELALGFCDMPDELLVLTRESSRKRRSSSTSKFTDEQEMVRPHTSLTLTRKRCNLEKRVPLWELAQSHIKPTKTR
jgi:hypothetical protein